MIREAVEEELQKAGIDCGAPGGDMGAGRRGDCEEDI